MTENPNIPSDPNAGQPPGPQTPGPQTPSAARSAGTGESADSVGNSGTSGAAGTPGSSGSSEAAKPTEADESAEAAKSAKSAAEPGEATASGTESPMAQNSATGSFSENSWAEPAGDEAEFGEPADPNAPNTGVAATFLPGIDAAAVLALVMAALAAGAYLLVSPLVQAHDAARTWSDFKNNVPRTKQDPFGVQRDWVSYQSWGHIILGLVAVLLALLVLGLWTARRNKLRSRSFAQAALVLGLAVVLYGILLKTGAVGSEIPNMKDISSGLSSSQ